MKLANIGGKSRAGQGCSTPFFWWERTSVAIERTRWGCSTCSCAHGFCQPPLATSLRPVCSDPAINTCWQMPELLIWTWDAMARRGSSPVGPQTWAPLGAELPSCSVVTLRRRGGEERWWPFLGHRRTPGRWDQHGGQAGRCFSALGTALVKGRCFLPAPGVNFVSAARFK